MTIKDKIESLFDTLQQLQHQRLAVNLLDEHQMHVIWESALNSVKSLNVQSLNVPVLRTFINLMLHMFVTIMKFNFTTHPLRIF